MRRAARAKSRGSATVVTGLKTAEIVYDESFGPVVTVGKFRTEQEAIDLANDSPFCLSASVWSADLERAERVARSIVTGNVSINNVLATQANSGLPFGGVKDSGFGRYRGSFGLHTFSNIKSIVVDKQSSKIELNWYPYSRRKFELFNELMAAAFGGNILAAPHRCGGAQARVSCKEEPSVNALPAYKNPSSHVLNA